MRKPLFYLCGLALATAIIVCAKPTEAANKVKEPNKTEPIKVLLVKQLNNYFGPTDLYIGENEALLIGREGKTKVLCKAPDWNVLVYSKDANKGLEQPLSKWEVAGLNAVNSKKNLAGRKRTATRDLQLKIDCWEIVIDANERYFGSDDPMIFRSLSKKSLKQVRFKSTRDLALSPNVTRFLRGLYNIPDFGGLPIELLNKFSDGSQTYFYRTKSMERTEVTASLFDTPVGYHKARDIAEILVGNLDKRQLTDLLDSLMHDEGQPKK